MKKGDEVKWKWGKSEAEGNIEEKHKKPVSKKIKGTEVKEKPAKKSLPILLSKKMETKCLNLKVSLKRAERNNSDFIKNQVSETAKKPCKGPKSEVFPILLLRHAELPNL